jgi:uncharacterized protein YuzE
MSEEKKVIFHEKTVGAKATYDEAVDAAYVYLRDHRKGELWRTISDGDAFAAFGINLDVDGDGRLVGIEILGASRRLPEEFLAELKRK